MLLSLLLVYISYLVFYVTSANGLDSALTLNASVNSKIVFSGDSVTITVQTMNGSDPIYNATIVLESDHGDDFTIPQGNTDLTGYFTTDFKAPQASEPTNMTITVFASKEGFLDSMRNITILALPRLTTGQFDLVIRCRNSTIDSGESTLIWVEATQNIDPIANASVFLSCDKGSFSPAGGITNSSGLAAFAYHSPSVEHTTTATIYATAISGYASANDSLEIVVNPSFLTHRAQASSTSFPTYGLINQKMRLAVQIINPSDFEVNVTVAIIAENISIFPSDHLSKLVPSSPSSAYQTHAETYEFDVTPLSLGDQSMEIQVLQHETLVNSRLVTFTIYDSMDPNLRSFWIFNLIGGFSFNLYTFAMIVLLNPEISWPKKIESGKTSYSIGKHLVLALATILFGLIDYALATNIPLYYSMIPYFISLVGKIEPVVGIGIFLSAFAWVSNIRKWYFVSSIFGDTVFLLTIFSLVWNSLLIPTFPFTLSQSILLQIIITALLKAVFMLVEHVWKDRHRVSKPSTI